MIVLGSILVGIAVAVLVYGWLEAGWLRTRVLEIEITGLPEALDGLRIGHLSDFHLGAPFSLGNRASARAVATRSPESPSPEVSTGSWDRTLSSILRPSRSGPSMRVAR